jgi:hypothetical protein
MPTPGDIWKKSVEEVGEDEIASAANVAPSRAEEDLHAAGFNVEAERAKAHEWLAELSGDKRPPSDRIEPTAWVTRPAPEGQERKRSTGRRRAVGIAVVLAALATAGGILYALGNRSKPPENPVEVPRQGPSPSASTPAPPPPTVQDIPSPAPRPNQDKPSR